jgi:hypothetical protein
MKSKLALVLLAGSLAGCSASVSAVRTEQAETVYSQQEDRAVRFFELVAYLRQPGHRVEDAKRIKAQSLAIAEQAGMHRQCDANKQCYLVYRDRKITIDAEFVNISIGSQHHRIEDLGTAIRLIYYS